MLRRLLLVTSPPGSGEARRALELANSLRAGGFDVGLVLLQDAVLAAIKHSRTPAALAVKDLLMKGTPVYAAEEDLALRGFPSANLAAGAITLNDGHLIDLMLADGTTLLGCL